MVRYLRCIAKHDFRCGYAARRPFRFDLLPERRPGEWLFFKDDFLIQAFTVNRLTTEQIAEIIEDHGRTSALRGAEDDATTRQLRGFGREVIRHSWSN